MVQENPTLSKPPPKKLAKVRIDREISPCSYPLSSFLLFPRSSGRQKHSRKIGIFSPNLRASVDVSFESLCTHASLTCNISIVVANNDFIPKGDILHPSSPQLMYSKKKTFERNGGAFRA
jgi:hypothetical protein